MLYKNNHSSMLERILKTYQWTNSGKPGIEISDALGMSDLERERLQYVIKHDKRKIKVLVHDRIMKTDYEDLDNIDINRLSIAPLAERLEQHYGIKKSIEYQEHREGSLKDVPNTDPIFRSIQDYFDKSYHYDYERLQDMLDRGMSYVTIARTYGGDGITKDMIANLVKKGKLSRPGRKK